MSAPKPIERIGRYQVLERVGKGGMGVLYRGFDPVLDREVAIKLMLTDFTEDTEQAEMFMEVYAERSTPLPLVPWEDQFETTVGQAMNSMFATIATGGKVTREDIVTAMQTAQDSIRA